MSNAEIAKVEREIAVLEWRLGVMRAKLESLKIGITVEPPKDVEKAFDRFWAAYPKARRANKKGVFKKFAKMGLACQIDAIVSDIEHRIAHDRSWNTGYIPLAMTYINQERWDSGIDVIHPIQKLGCLMNKTDAPSADALMSKYSEDDIKACVIEATTLGQTPFLSHVAKMLSSKSIHENIESNTYFDKFWAAYPIKESKVDCIILWKTHNLETYGQTILEDVTSRVLNDPKWIDGYAPSPLNYLKGRRWQDEKSKSTAENNSDIINAILAGQITTKEPPKSIENIRIISAGDEDISW